MEKKTLWALMALVMVMLLGGCANSGMPDDTIVKNPEEEVVPNDQVRIPLSDGLKSMMLHQERSFSMDMLKEAYLSTGGNVFISPYSVYVTLSMAANGCTGESREKLLNILMGEKFLSGDLTIDDLNEANRIMLEYLPKVDNQVKCSIANSFWLTPEKKSDLLKDFSTGLGKNYYADLIFQNPSGTQGMNAINNWVEENTNSLIKNFLTSPLSGEEDMAFLNACYFHGKWREQFFDEKNSREMTFTNLDGTKVKTDFMCFGDYEEILCESYNYHTIFCLDFGNTNYCISLILPDEGVNLEELIKDLKYKEIFPPLHESGSIKLNMPKFKTTYSMDTEKVFDKMGISDILKGGLDNVLSSQNVAFGGAIHTATIELNEKGASAAGAITVPIYLGYPNIHEGKHEITFDRPFLYYIIEKTTATIIYCGCVTEF